MLDKIKKLDLKSVWKYLLVFFLWLVWIFLVIMFLSLIYSMVSSILPNSSLYSSSSKSYFWWNQISSRNTWIMWNVDFGMDDSYDYAEEAEYWVENVANDYVDDWDYDTKSHNAFIESKNIEEDCDNFLSWLNADYIKRNSVNLNKKTCSFNIWIKRWNEDKFIEFINTFDVKELNTNITNMAKTYSWLTSKTEDIKKKIEETERLLEETKTWYDELWNSIKIQNMWADWIDALNKIINNKANLINKFTQQREKLNDELNVYIKQITDLNEMIWYTDFYVYFSEKKVLDLESIKNGWYYDFKTMVYDVDETFRDLSVNLVSFVMIVLKSSIYIVISVLFFLFFGKWLYVTWRKIIKWKPQKQINSKK